MTSEGLADLQISFFAASSRARRARLKHLSLWIDFVLFEKFFWTFQFE